MTVTVGIVSSVLIFLVVGLVPPSAGAQQFATPSSDVEFARVRSSQTRLASLVAEARERSHTFRALVASIEDTDGIVFVDEGRCRRGVAACLTWQVTLAGPYRMLFVRLDIRKSDVDVMASIGHELQHALEVLANPSLTSTAAIQLFYMHGFSTESLRTIETAAAEAMGNAVFLEVQRSRSAERKQ